MTVTEATPTAAPEAAAATVPSAPTGLAAVVGASDHKTIGRLYIATSILFLLLAGVTGALLSVERIDTAGLAVLNNDTLRQVFTLHSVSAAFLFLIPLLIGLATTVVPLQVGAATIAFPRAAALAFWTYLVAGALVIASFAINGGPYGGDHDGVTLFVVAFAAVLVALVVATICVVTTVIGLRAPGMTLARTPLFAWSSMVAGVVWLLTLPVVFGTLVLIYLDHRNGNLFVGGNFKLYVRISWTFGQPSLYAFAIPALGIVGDIVPVFASTRHKLHRVAMGAIGAFGILSIGAWAQPAFTLNNNTRPSAPYLFEAPWVAVSFAIVLPALALLGLWAQTLRAGRPRLESPLIYAVGAVLMLLVGLVAGAASAIDPLDVYGTTWTTATAHYVLLATTLALLGGLTFWAPKIFGRKLAEGPSRAAALLLLAGTIVMSFPDIVSGAFKQPQMFGAVTKDTSTVEALNLVSVIGGALVLIALLLFLVALLGAARSSELPGDDPWQGHTLEWTTSSPPPVGNYATLPEISSEAPLYDARHASSVEAAS